MLVACQTIDRHEHTADASWHLLAWLGLVNLCLACRWTGNNGPEQTDYIAMRNLIDATPKSVKRFVLTTSAGVDRSNKIPFSILNLFGETILIAAVCLEASLA